MWEWMNVGRFGGEREVSDGWDGEEGRTLFLRNLSHHQYATE